MVVLNRATCDVLGSQVGQVQEDEAENYCEDIAYGGYDLQWFAQCLRAPDNDSDGWRDCPDSLTELIQPGPEDFEPLDHDLNSVPAGSSLLIFAFERPASPNSPMTFSIDKGAFGGWGTEFTCGAPGGGPIVDADCFSNGDLIPGDGAMGVVLEIPSDEPLGTGHITITQDGESIAEEFVVTGPAASMLVENVTGRSALLSDAPDCEYPSTAAGLRSLALGDGDARRNALIVRLFDANLQPVVWYASWYWPFASNGSAIFVAGTTVTLDLGPSGLGAVQLVCGIAPGQDTSSVWLGFPVAPPLVYQNLTVTVLDPSGNQDGDACTNGRELGANPVVGGDRDPLEPWDFYDVTGDKTVDLNDALVILAAFGQSPAHPEYNSGLDRQSNDPTKPWRSAPATGNQIGIDLQDALLNLQSFGHNCN